MSADLQGVSIGLAMGTWRHRWRRIRPASGRVIRVRHTAAPISAACVAAPAPGRLADAAASAARRILYVPCSDGGSAGAECISPWGPCPPWSHGGTSVASAGAAMTGADFCVPSVVVGGGAVRRRSSTGRRLGRSGGASAIGSTSLAARFTCGRARNGSSSISTCGLGMRGERGGRRERRPLREASRVSGDGDGDGEVRSPFESSPGGGRGAERSRASASLGCIVQAPICSPGQRSGTRSFWTSFQSPAAPRRRSYGRR